jgi:hypothetical protein
VGGHGGITLAMNEISYKSLCFFNRRLKLNICRVIKSNDEAEGGLNERKKEIY